MVNRGFAVLGDRLFMATLDAHVMALDRKTGTPIWDVPMIDYRLGYSSTAAPLVVKDKLIVGMAGGELATRGFLDAYSLNDRQAPLALQHHSGAWRTWRRHLAGRSLRARRWRHVDHRLIRSRAEPPLLGRRQPEPAISTAAIATATTSIPHRWSRSTPTPDACDGISSTRRTTSTTGTRIRSRCSPISRLAADRARRSSRPIATASSTCSIARTARSSRPSPT